MIQFSEGYNAQTIFDQVWEAPYEWFGLFGKNGILPAIVCEFNEDGEVISKKQIMVEDIEAATIKHYMEIVSKRTGSQARTMADYLEDLDADDVDCILQWAMFDEVRYG